MKNRPLSPHLTIYKAQITSLVSIFHRISGTCLALTAIFLLLVFSMDIVLSEYYLSYSQIFTIQTYAYWFFSSLGYLLLSLCIFHVSNGIRHLIWDTCMGLESRNVTNTGILVLTSSLLILFFILL